jgi:cytochrome b pre-mRNA-processing protein 3
MFGAFRARAALRRKAGEIYGAIVTQARRPAFYAILGIPDTPAGRYEMIVLHLFLVLERLRAEGLRATVLQRTLIETFVEDMDDSLRELGTGDVVVGKKVRRATAGFYERSKDYRDALGAGDAGALERAIVRHGLASEGDPQASRALSAYVRAAAHALAAQGGPELLAGRLSLEEVPIVARETR